MPYDRCVRFADKYGADENRAGGSLVRRGASKKRLKQRVGKKETSQQRIPVLIKPGFCGASPSYNVKPKIIDFLSFF